MPIQVEVTGLQPHTSYHFRLSATNENGAATSDQEGTFKTAVAAEPPGEVVTGAAEGVTATGAVLTGRLNPHGGASYYFEYGEASCGAEACGRRPRKRDRSQGRLRKPRRLQP